jgi:hypothetical protein
LSKLEAQCIQVSADHGDFARQIPVEKHACLWPSDAYVLSSH